MEAGRRASQRLLFGLGGFARLSTGDGVIESTVDDIPLLTAIVMGIAFFGDWPDPLGLAGAARIVSGGPYLWRSLRPR